MVQLSVVNAQIKKKFVIHHFLIVFFLSYFISLFYPFFFYFLNSHLYLFNNFRINLQMYMQVQKLTQKQNPS